MKIPEFPIYEWSNQWVKFINLSTVKADIHMCTLYRIAQFLAGKILMVSYFIEKFDRENIDGQHLRPPVLSIVAVTGNY